MTQERIEATTVPGWLVRDTIERLDLAPDVAERSVVFILAAGLQSLANRAVLPGGEVVGLEAEIIWCHHCLALRGRDCTDQEHKVSLLYRLVADEENDDE